jgi:hypothetical protein
MNRKFIAIIAALSLVSPALAADNKTAKDAAAASFTLRMEDRSSVFFPVHMCVTLADETIDCMTAANASLDAIEASLAAIEADTSAVESNISTATARLLSAAGTSQDETAISASPCTITRFTGYNASSSARYIKFYNNTTAAVTVGTTTPEQTFYLPATTAFSIEVQRKFSTACTFALLTAAADNSTSSVTAGDIVALNVDYR